MKHLKSFNESFDRLERLLPHVGNDIISDINDICLEAEEDGFAIVDGDFECGGSGKYKVQTRFSLIIKPKVKGKLLGQKITNDEFEIDKVVDVILRLVDFMKQHKFSTRVQADAWVLTNTYSFHSPGSDKHYDNKVSDVTDYFNGKINYENILGFKFHGIILTFTDDTIKPRVRSFHDMDDDIG